MNLQQILDTPTDTINKRIEPITERFELQGFLSSEDSQTLLRMVQGLAFKLEVTEEREAYFKNHYYKELER